MTCTWHSSITLALRDQYTSVKPAQFILSCIVINKIYFLLHSIFISLRIPIHWNRHTILSIFSKIDMYIVDNFSALMRKWIWLQFVKISKTKAVKLCKYYLNTCTCISCETDGFQFPSWVYIKGGILLGVCIWCVYIYIM